LVRRLELRVNEAVIDHIIQDMADISTPLKQFTDAVMSNETTAEKRGLVDQRGQSLKERKSTNVT
jgi:C4-dicarboxylate-specific signal transduction histidine kinase